MGLRIPYTTEEYTLCTYAAMYGDEDLGGIYVMNLNGHPGTSVQDKVRNIATDLDGMRIARHPKWRRLTGRTSGMGPRYTRWDLVEPLTRLPSEVLLERCRIILGRART